MKGVYETKGNYVCSHCTAYGKITLVGKDNNCVARFLPLEIAGAYTILEAPVSRIQRLWRVKTPGCDSKLKLWNLDQVWKYLVMRALSGCLLSLGPCGITLSVCYWSFAKRLFSCLPVFLNFSSKLFLFVCLFCSSVLEFFHLALHFSCEFFSWTVVSWIWYPMNLVSMLAFFISSLTCGIHGVRIY